MRTTSRLWFLPAATAVFFTLITSSTGCTGDECDDGGCAEGVEVSWSPAEFPAGIAQAPLCADGACGRIMRPDGRVDRFGDLVMGGGHPLGRGAVNVRLELFDATGHLLHSVEGTGTPSGGCCRFVAFEPTADGGALRQVDT